VKAGRENTTAKRLREWWRSPPRSGIQRLIAPPEYRHLRGFGITRITGGVVAAAAGIVCLPYEAYGWATFFVVIAALDLVVGCWELALARARSSRA